MLNPKRVLVIAAHADDEIIGCGGTLARYKEEGRAVEVILCTKVGGCRGDNTLIQNVTRLSKSLKVKYHYLDFKDQGLDVLPQIELNQAIETIITKFKPDTIFTHSKYDNNLDHVAVHKSVCVAARAVSNLLFFHIPSLGELEVTPKQMFINIDWDTKKTLLQYYDVEMRPYPHPRSYEALESSIESYAIGRLNV